MQISGQDHLFIVEEVIGISSIVNDCHIFIILYLLTNGVKEVPKINLVNNF